MDGVIAFDSRCSGKSTKIKNYILKDMEAYDYDIVCVSMSKHHSEIIKSIITYEKRNYPGSIRPNIIFTTYDCFYRDTVGRHPKKIFFDDITIERMIVMMSYLFPFEDCKYLMLGSIDQFITEAQRIYRKVADTDFEIRVLKTEIHRLHTMNQNLSGRLHFTSSFLDIANKMISKLERKLKMKEKKKKKKKKKEKKND